MSSDSLRIFHDLMQGLTLDESPEEKKAILFWVMEHEFGLSRAAVMAGKKITVNETSLRSILHRLNQHEPVQYIFGEADFYGRKFYVDPTVLIPRPETELIIEMALPSMWKKKSKVLDVGTGSGILAITLAAEAPGTTVFATDISNEALGIAKKNAGRHQVAVTFQVHDVLRDPWTYETLDLVVSNPPYIMNTEKETMDRNVIAFEPSLALFVADADPLVFYRAIAKNAFTSLTPGGLLVTEINQRFGPEVAELFTTLGYSKVSIAKDLNGNDRVVSGVKPD